MPKQSQFDTMEAPSHSLLLGIIVSAAWIVRYHGESSMAAEMLKHHGITKQDLLHSSVEEFDREPLIKLLK